MRHALLRHLAILALLAFSQPCWATPITINFEGAFVPSGGEQPLPIYVDNNEPNPDSVRFRYSVPDAALIDSLNSVRVSVDVYDDGDNPNNETGNVVFILNGIGQPNFEVASFGDGLNGTTSDNPLTVGDFVNPEDFANVLAEIQEDGIFFIRLNRTGGDYFVQDATVEIDANLVPEPASWILIGLGLGSLLIVCCVARTRSWRRIARASGSNASPKAENMPR